MRIAELNSIVRVWVRVEFELEVEFFREVGESCGGMGAEGEERQAWSVGRFDMYCGRTGRSREAAKTLNGVVVAALFFFGIV